MKPTFAQAAVAVSAGVFAAACSSATPAQSELSTAVRSFTQHPAYCSALIDKRVSGRPMPEGATPDREASIAFDKLMKLAGNEERQHHVLSSLLSACANKSKNVAG